MGGITFGTTYIYVAPLLSVAKRLNIQTTASTHFNQSWSWDNPSAETPTASQPQRATQRQPSECRAPSSPQLALDLNYTHY